MPTRTLADILRDGMILERWVPAERAESRGQLEAEIADLVGRLASARPGKSGGG
jgi:hypothetical protein